MQNFSLLSKFTTFLFLLLVSLTGKSVAQSKSEMCGEIDSLNEISKTFSKTNFDSATYYAHKALLLAKEDSCFKGKAEALSMLADAYFFQGSFDSSMEISNSVLGVISNNLKMEDLRFSTYYRICKIHHYKGEYAMALHAADSALEKLTPGTPAKYPAMIFSLKGLILKRKGEFKKAQELFIEALAYVDDDVDNQYAEGVILTNLGIVNRNLKQYPQALDYYERALVCNKNADDINGIGHSYQNIAAVYSDIGDYEKSLSFNFLALDIAGKQNHQSIEYATLLNNIGLNYDGFNQSDSARKYLNLALKLSIDMEDTYGIADTKINLGRVYLKNNMPRAARKIIEEGLLIANTIEAEDIVLEGYEMLIECQVATNNYKEAFITQKLLNALHDSVYSIEKTNAINELQEKYESEKKEQRIALLETESELKGSELKQKRMQRNGLIGFAVLIVLITLIILYYLRKTQKAKNKIEILQREIHHRVKNNLAIIRRLANVARQNLKDASAQLALTELTNRIESMAQVHAQLYQKSDITEVNLKSYLNELADNIHASFSHDNMQLLQDVQPSIHVDFNKAVPLGLIINELLTNAFKYAKNDAGLKISLEAVMKTDTMLIKVSDNGQGLPEGFDLQRLNSYGLKLVKGLAQQLGGTVQFFNKSGTLAELRIPA
jgi:two-component sensor histidine kinase